MAPGTQKRRCMAWFVVRDGGTSDPLIFPCPSSPPLPAPRCPAPPGPVGGGKDEGSAGHGRLAAGRGLLPPSRGDVFQGDLTAARQPSCSRHLHTYRPSAWVLGVGTPRAGAFVAREFMRITDVLPPQPKLWRTFAGCGAPTFPSCTHPCWQDAHRVDQPPRFFLFDFGVKSAAVVSSHGSFHICWGRLRG